MSPITLGIISSSGANAESYWSLLVTPTYYNDDVYHPGNGSLSSDNDGNPLISYYRRGQVNMRTMKRNKKGEDLSSVQSDVTQQYVFDSSNNMFGIYTQDGNSYNLGYQSIASDFSSESSGKQAYGIKDGVKNTEIDSNDNIYTSAGLSIGRVNLNTGAGIKITETAASNYYSKCAGFDINGNIYYGGAEAIGQYTPQYLAKFDSSGILQWQYKYDTGWDAKFVSIKAASDGNIIVLGENGNGQSPGNYFQVYKIDASNGDILWKVNLNVVSDRANYNEGSIHLDAEDNVYFCAEFNYQWSSVYYRSDIVKIAANGDHQWTRRMGFNFGLGSNTNGQAMYVDGNAINFSSEVQGQFGSYSGKALLFNRLPLDGNFVGYHTNYWGNFTWYSESRVFPQSTSFNKSSASATFSTSSITAASETTVPHDDLYTGAAFGEIAV
jgi:hypothetical protein